MKLYDTLTRKALEISLTERLELSFYCCGPTVYGPAHIGNFRAFLMQDVLRRALEARGHRVRHVRNITDVDDKTITQSQVQGKTLGDFTAHWTEKFHRDAAQLQMLPPTHETSAVEHIPQQIDLIEKLVSRNLAYRGEDGSVYFRVSAFSEYGKLSRLKEREITTTTREGATVQADEYSREAATDFALWKARKPADGANFWCSPWGEGRPGWHIECSAMCMHYVGSTVDIHSGGVDLIFPHHENEIAQSEGRRECPLRGIGFTSRISSWRDRK